MNNSVRILDPSEGDLLGVAGDNYRVIVGGADTGGSFSVLDMLIPPGGGPVPHAHPDIQEWFYVLDGELEYKTTAGTSSVGRGGFVYVPRGGAIHCFKNRTDKVARVLCVVIPAGLEEFFKEFGVPVKAGEFPPPVTLTPELEARLEELNRKYGQQTYPPDYLG